MKGLDSYGHCVIHSKAFIKHFAIRFGQTTFSTMEEWADFVLFSGARRLPQLHTMLEITCAERVRCITFVIRLPLHFG